MYRPHMGGRLVPATFDIPDLTVPLPEGEATLAGLSGSASIRDKVLTVTLTNPSLRDAVATRVRVSGGARVREARATVLTHPDMQATNTFEKPHEVGIAALTAQVSGDTATITIPTQAIVAITLALA
jgi:alpha-N-arabinofuranosidase